MICFSFVLDYIRFVSCASVMVLDVCWFWCIVLLFGFCILELGPLAWVSGVGFVYGLVFWLLVIWFAGYGLCWFWFILILCVDFGFRFVDLICWLSICWFWCVTCWLWLWICWFWSLVFAFGSFVSLFVGCGFWFVIFAYSSCVVVFGLRLTNLCLRFVGFGLWFQTFDFWFMGCWPWFLGCWLWFWICGCWLLSWLWFVGFG